jgi:uncharacterized coiled-coil protein SlyX
MDKKELEERLKGLEKLKASHEQDIVELSFVIDGLKDLIKNSKK